MKKLVLLLFCALAAGGAAPSAAYPASANLTASDIVNLTAYAAFLKAQR
jgi:hypothetical protein